MRLLRHPTATLMLCALPLAASGCAPRAVATRIYPPPADLRVEPKPRAGADILTSAQAAAEHDIAIEAWGMRGWAAVARLCRWARANGMAVECAPAAGER